jgi:hypothetical protein
VLAILHRGAKRAILTRVKDKNIFCRTKGTAFQLLCLVDENQQKLVIYYIVFMGMPSAVPYSRSGLLTGGRGGNLSSDPLNLVKAL